MKILKMPNPIQHLRILRQTQANFTQHSVQTRPTSLIRRLEPIERPAEEARGQQRWMKILKMPNPIQHLR